MSDKIEADDRFSGFSSESELENLIAEASGTGGGANDRRFSDEMNDAQRELYRRYPESAEAMIRAHTRRSRLV